MDTFDPFRIMGLPREYHIDPAQLERAYLERSAELHPDLLSAAAIAGMGSEDDEQIGDLNRARQILADPEQRAVALWKLWGGMDAGEDKSLPPGFLMEMMETREEIEQAKTLGAATRMHKWESWAEDRRREYQANVGRLFEKLVPDAPANASVLKQIKLELNAWRYIERLVEQLD